MSPRNSGRGVAGPRVRATYEAVRPDGTRFRNTEIHGFDGDLIRRQEVSSGWDLPAASAG